MENIRQQDQILLDAIINFAAKLGHPEISPFQQDLKNWGDQWHQVAPAYLPASDLLQNARTMANADTRNLVELFYQQRTRLRWEQSYSKKDNVVGDDMLNGYGFVEIVGQHGPFVSDKVRSGIGVWAPDIVYPEHWHQAAEIYLVLSGSACFKLGDSPEKKYSPGEMAYVSSNLPHGFKTEDELLVVFYIWRGVQMRQKSSFKSK